MPSWVLSNESDRLPPSPTSQFPVKTLFSLSLAKEASKVPISDIFDEYIAQTLQVAERPGNECNDIRMDLVLGLDAHSWIILYITSVLYVTTIIIIIMVNMIKKPL
jgi:hypothetical protein